MKSTIYVTIYFTKLKGIPVGQCVELTVCRGYPLSIDPNDPNIEIMPLAAINNPYQINGGMTHQHQSGAPLAAVDELTASTILNGGSAAGSSKQQQASSATNCTTNGTGCTADGNMSSGSNDEYYCEEYEEMYASIVKGPKGFGFTIADDSQMNHQKVRHLNLKLIGVFFCWQT